MRYFAALLLVSVAAQANAGGPTTYKLAEVCKFDLEQYCKAINMKRLRDVKACLAEHHKALLPRCQDHYQEAMK